MTHRPPSPETLKRHGITEEQWHELYAAQGGRCGVCRKEHPEYVIDHDHRRGQKRIRGLCGRTCNGLLGKIRDSADWARGAADYLTNPPADSLDSFRNLTYPEPTRRRTGARRGGTK